MADPVRTCGDWGRLVQQVSVVARSDHDIHVAKRRVLGWSFFREGIRPAWEDPFNDGGTTLSARATLPPDRGEALWTDLLADCARNYADTAVLGVHLTHKRTRFVAAVKIDVWLAPAAATDTIRAWLAHVAAEFAFEVVPRRK